MDFILQRYSDNGKSTQGILLEKSDPHPIFFSHALEDEHRDIKVSGETRIPAGFYELKIRKEDTVLTIKHRAAYNANEKEPWFFYHIEITGIANFSSVYIHSGVNDTHTEGCLLIMDTMNNNIVDSLDESRSLQAVKRFYQKVYTHLESGKKSWIEIRDEEKLV